MLFNTTILLASYKHTIAISILIIALLPPVCDLANIVLLLRASSKIGEAPGLNGDVSGICLKLEIDLIVMIFINDSKFIDLLRLPYFFLKKFMMFLVPLADVAKAFSLAVISSLAAAFLTDLE